jgi:hypothetical protein
MGGACGTHGEVRNFTMFQLVDLKRRDLVRELGV